MTAIGEHAAGTPRTARQPRECARCYSTIHAGQRYREFSTNSGYAAMCDQCRHVPPAPERSRKFEHKQVRATREFWRWHDVDQALDDLDAGRLSANDIAHRLGCSARTVVRRRARRRAAAA